VFALRKRSGGFQEANSTINWNLQFINVNFSVDKHSIAIVYADNFYTVCFFVHAVLLFKLLKAEDYQP